VGLNVVALVFAVVVVIVAFVWVQNEEAANKQRRDDAQRSAQDIAKRNQDMAERMRQESELRRKEDELRRKEEVRRKEEEVKRKEEERQRKLEAQHKELADDPVFQQQKQKSQANLRTLAKALLEFERKNGSLPKRVWGKTFNEWSWRVAILPYLGEDELYRQLKFDEGPNSPYNRKLLANMPAVF